MTIFTQLFNFKKQMIFEKEYSSNPEIKYKHAVIFAMYDKNGQIPDNLICYLKELKKYSDYIVLCSDCEIKPEETEKAANIVDYVYFVRHKEYDFGSYKRGWKILKEHSFFKELEYITFCNDSVCFAGHSLEPYFKQQVNYDAYGMTINNYPFRLYEKGLPLCYQPHIQSFFFSLSKNIYNAKWFNNFISNVKKLETKEEIIIKYEVTLSSLIQNNNFNINSYYPCDKNLLEPSGYYLNELSPYNGVKLLYKKSEIFKYSTINPESITRIGQNEQKYLFRYRLKKIIQNIFSVKNQDSKHKVIKIFGIKIKIKRQKNKIKDLTNDYINIIKNSQYFDASWFGSYYSYKKTNESLEEYFLDCKNLNPSPYFYSNEYRLMYPDVACANQNPLIHYEKCGCKEGRFTSIADIKYIIFPKGTINIKKELNPRREFSKKKAAVIASYSGNGKLSDTLLYLVKGLKEICDYIILVSDNPIFEEETERLKDYCNYCIFERHEEYDFGSYKRGYQFLTENNILKEDDDLIFVNDSNYGPVYPFSEVIDDYNNKDCDFYGLSISNTPIIYIQSFFYIFKPNVYNSKVFKEFILNIKKQLTPAHVVFKYEMQFTQYLCKNGFHYESYVNMWDFINFIQKKEVIPTKWSLSLIKRYRYPFLKVKVLTGSSFENPQEILEYVKQENNELYSLIKPDIDKKLAAINHKEIKKVSKYTLFKEYDTKVSELKTKIASGEKIKVTFLVNMLSMFPAEMLMQKMLKNNYFDVELYVIPEVRFGKEYMIKTLKESYEFLKNKYDFVKLAVDINNENEITKYNDIIKNADIVCYPSPYNVSFSLYNPFYAFQNNILSIHINYGFFRSKYDRHIYKLDNYNNFWKVFLETDMNFIEYKKYGQCKGANALVTGYAKMDNMYHLFEDKKINERKKIIIAPHHSVDNGYNDVLALSNFERLADFLLILPEKYPQIDFIFRPHPMLFNIMEKNNHWGEEKVQKYLYKLLSYKNVTYSTEGNYLKLFANSDGIIQDCGSFLVEYFYTKKPQCYILKNKIDIETKFSELGKKCLEHCYISYTEEDIFNYLNYVILEEIDPKKSSREEFAQNVIMKNYPHVSDEIIKEIINEIEGQ